MKRVSMHDAVSRISDGAVVAVSGGGYRVAPEGLLETLERHFEDTGTPKGITLLAISMIEQSRGGKGGRGTGLNRLAKPGLVSRVITSSFSRGRDHELNAAIVSESIAAHSMPMGTLVQWLRAAGMGSPGVLTDVGLGTYIDPRVEGGMMNSVDQTPISRVVNFEGNECLFYPAPKVDVALIKGTTADTNGNIYLEREAFSLGVLHTAMAAHNCGGMVIAQVNRIVEPGVVHPRMGRVPGPLVDFLCVDDRVWEDEQDPILTGESRLPLSELEKPTGVRGLIARRVVKELQPDAEVNLGAGIPMYDIPVAAVAEGRDDLYFTIEQGPVGGLPRVGGVARNPAVILDSLEVFDYYEGGGPDVTCLSFGQLDRHGNVNVSRFASVMPGCGGFPNIAHRIQNLVFCGTLTTGGLKQTVGDGRLHIETEGSIRRLVPDVEQITFNGQRALKKGQSITVVTDRCVMRLRRGGFVITEVAPGVDLQADVLDQISFEVSVDPDLKTMDVSLFV